MFKKNDKIAAFMNFTANYCIATAETFILSLFILEILTLVWEFLSHDLGNSKI